MSATVHAANFPEARLRCKKLMPYVSQYVMSLIPVEKPGLGTFGTDKWGRCYYDPECLTRWSMDEAAGVILHEALHLILKFHKRAGDYLGDNATPIQIHEFNLAQDLVINQMLQDASIPLPQGQDKGVYPADYGFPTNLSTEEYYDLLEKQRQQQQGGKHGKCPQGGGQDGPQVGRGHCGSCADGKPKPWEDGAPDGSNAEGLSDYDQMMLERLTAREIEEYKRTKDRGNIPGELLRLAEEILRPKTNPARELLAKVKFAVNAVNSHGDYTWRKLPRRMPPGSVRLPAHVQPIPRVKLIIDTSGSMDKEDLGLALGVVGQVVKCLPSEGVEVLAGDTHVAAVTRVFRPEQVKLAGGGGTDMSVLIEEAAEMKPRPDVICVLSDGETPWPAAPVGPRVVACLTRKSEYYEVPEWMEVVYLERA